MAISLKKIKLKMLMENNRAWPLVIGGAMASDIRDAAVMPATISVRDLNTGEWVAELETLGRGRDWFPMVIDGLDKLTPAAQEKFIRLVKDRRAGIYKLPKNIQIIIPVKNISRVSQEIQKLALVYNV